MIFRLFRRSGNDAVIDRLYAATVEASRQPVLYRHFAVPDTFEGRFESLTLHAALLLRRLKSGEPPGPDMAQHLVDTIFRNFDRTMREMGVGDLTVPKRMKRLAEAFFGRSSAYDAALREGDEAALTAALVRNLRCNEEDGGHLCAYVRACEKAMAGQQMQAFIDGTLPFADPSDYACRAQ